MFVGAKDNWNERVLSPATGLGVKLAVCAASATMADSRTAISVFECGRNIMFRFLAGALFSERWRVFKCCCVLHIYINCVYV